MPFYIKKPIVVEAMEITDMGNDLVRFCPNIARFAMMFDGKPSVLISTLEGEMWATIGDYIIKGVEGEYYPCKRSIFHATYDPLSKSQEV